MTQFVVRVRDIAREHGEPGRSVRAVDFELMRDGNLKLTFRFRGDR